MLSLSGEINITRFQRQAIWRSQLLWEFYLVYSNLKFTPKSPTEIQIGLTKPLTTRSWKIQRRVWCIDGKTQQPKEGFAKTNTEEQSSIPIPYMLVQLEIFMSWAIYLCHFNFSLCFDREKLSHICFRFRVSPHSHGSSLKECTCMFTN